MDKDESGNISFSELSEQVADLKLVTLVPTNLSGQSGLQWPANYHSSLLIVALYIFNFDCAELFQRAFLTFFFMLC